MCDTFLDIQNENGQLTNQTYKKKIKRSIDYRHGDGLHHSFIHCRFVFFASLFHSMMMIMDKRKQKRNFQKSIGRFNNRKMWS